MLAPVSHFPLSLFGASLKHNKMCPCKVHNPTGMAVTHTSKTTATIKVQGTSIFPRLSWCRFAARASLAAPALLSAVLDFH